MLRRADQGVIIDILRPDTTMPKFACAMSMKCLIWNKERMRGRCAASLCLLLCAASSFHSKSSWCLTFVCHCVRPCGRWPCSMRPVGGRRVSYEDLWLQSRGVAGSTNSPEFGKSKGFVNSKISDLTASTSATKPVSGVQYHLVQSQSHRRTRFASPFPLHSAQSNLLHHLSHRS